MAVVRVFTCDICGKSETMPDMVFASDFPQPDGWGVESSGDGYFNVCSRECASQVLAKRVQHELDRRYPVPAA